MDSFEKIYNSMLGSADSDDALPWVQNAFAEGSHCAREREELQEACLRIREHLGIWDQDADLDIILDCLESIQKELCFRMFDTGIQYVREKHYLSPGQYTNGEFYGRFLK